MKSKCAIFLLLATSLFMNSCGGNGGNEPTPNPSEPTPTSTRLNVEVLDYSPAPGQFINEIPEYEIGDTYESMNDKATQSLCNGDMISLGAWGGSVTIKLPYAIPNIEGKYDFRIVGNAVYANDASNAIRIGSSEPGIVLVMQDSNNNNLPDDTWYELRGNQWDNTISNYQVTYHYPSENEPDSTYIKWMANDGSIGYLNRTAEHQQAYFPLWMNQNSSLTFSGKRLPNNGTYNSLTGKFDLACYNGYADAHPNNVEASCLDISNAVDQYGAPINLTSINFIKVYTGVLQINGPLGECSTEIAAIEQIIYQ